MQIKREDNEELLEFIIRNSYVDRITEDHRKGSTFYVTSIIEITDTLAKTIVQMVDTGFEPAELKGLWLTNTYVWSEEDWDIRDITKLTKVDRVESQVVTTVVEYVPCSI